MRRENAGSDGKRWILGLYLFGTHKKIVIFLAWHWAAGYFTKRGACTQSLKCQRNVAPNWTNLPQSGSAPSDPGDRVSDDDQT